MTLVISDRVVETTTTTGTGDLALAGAVTGYQRFSAKMSVGDTCYYSIEAVDTNGIPTGDWETGIGTYSALNTLTRTTIKDSSNAGSVVTLATGTKRVMLTILAAEMAALTPTPGAVALIGSVTASGSSGVMTVSSIPNTAKDLIVVTVGRNDSAASQIASMAINGAPSGDIQRHYALAGSAFADFLLNGNIGGYFTAYPGTNYAAGMVSHQEMTIFEYANTNFWKNFHLMGRQQDSTTTGNSYVMHASGAFRATAAITSVTATLAAGNWVSGSAMRVYGRT